MIKVLSIGWKDFLLIFRDRAALILMLAAPFALTLGMGLVTGQFSGASSGLSGIPVVIVNQDGGTLGDSLVDIFNSADLADLFEPATETDVGAARLQVDEDQVAALVIIPAGFTGSLLPADSSGAAGDAVQIEVYSSPARPISAGVVQSVVSEFVNRVETARIGGQVAVSQLVQHGRIDGQQAAQVGMEIGQRLGEQPVGLQVRIQRTASVEAERSEINYLAFLAPGMALTFLMYTVSLGGRSILAERRDGTLARLMTTPTSAAQVFGGKVFGIFLIGVAQMSILIVANRLLFNVDWGDPLGVAALVLAVAAGATGWGLLLAAIAKTPAQVSSAGMAMMLFFGLLGGNLVFGIILPDWVQMLGKATPNAWGREGFDILVSGGTLADLGTQIAALVFMGAVLFAVAVAVFRRTGMLSR